MWLTITILLSAAMMLKASSPVLLDVNPTGSGSPFGLTNVDGTLFFFANGVGLEKELWKSDGTVAGTVFVANTSLHVRTVAAVDGILFFSAYDDVGDAELWKSDGTEAGTVRVKDINPTTWSRPRDLIVVDGTLHFTADDGVHGEELWKSDGTEMGTELVADLYTGGSSSSPFWLTNVDGTLFFVVRISSAIQLWKSDGTTAGTVRVFDFGSTRIDSLTNVGGTLFFVVDDDSSGDELWKSDGTESGTELVADVNPTGDDRLGQLTDVDGTLFFRADDGMNGVELWKSDGTQAGTVLVADINPSGDSSPGSLTNVGGTLFFSANDGTNGEELWKSDGTPAGTVLVADINPSGDSSPAWLANVGGTLFFQANDGVNGIELWKSDGTQAGTVLVADINPGSGNAQPQQLTNVGGTLFFVATDGTNGAELWALSVVSETTVTADITVELDTQPDSGVDVQFTHNVEPQGAFTLDDDTDATHANNVTLTPAKPGQYRVTLQGLPAKHQLAAIQCDSDAVTVQLDQRRVLVDFDDKNVTCTFVVVGLGSCCSKHANDGCVKNISEEECLAIDRQATWTFDGDCGQDECPRGACCLQFGHCDDRSSPDVCAAKGGSFNGLATKCDSKTCGACCGGNTVDGCADDIARSQCSSTATHVGGQRCAQSCGACCEDSTCTPRAQTSLNGKPCASFILGDYKCSKQCGSCCGESNCFDNKFESQCGTNSAFSTGSCDNTCGACCDDGSCKLTLGSGECSTGLFQGVGSNCGGDTCPLGNVCCQNDEDQPCLTDIDAVEDCTGAGQFAAENCNECLVRFAQLNLIVSSESNEISLSGADARKRNVESSSSSSSTSSSSYSSSSSSKSSRCSSSSSSSSSSSNNDCPLSIDMNVIVNNASPLTFNNVVIDVFVTMPRTAVVSSVNAEIGTFQWTKHTLHDSQVTGHGQWTIATLVGGDHPQLLFDIELKQPHVGENVQMHATLVSSEPSATSSAQEFIVTLTE